MRVFALGLSVLLCTVAGFSQSTSVMIEELTTNEVADAVAAGKTTAIYYVGGAHQNGDAVAIGKHNALAGHLARRVAEELGNALSYPVNPYAPAGDPVEKTGHMRFPGTTSVSEETFRAVSKDVVRSAIAAGFTHVALMGDHGGGQGTLEEVASEMDAAAPMGVHVFYVPVYEMGEEQMQQHLTRLNVEPERQTPIDDVSEIMAIDPENKLVRPQRIPSENAGIVSAELGRTFIDNKVRSAVDHIRREIEGP